MFYAATGSPYRVKELDRFEWLDHGFGTRFSDGWVPEPFAWVRQIHSSAVLTAGAEGCLGRADAMVSNTPGLYLAIRTADCVPLLMADPRVRAVAAVHAGWKGTVAGIAAAAVAALSERFSSRPEDLVMAIGPHICGKCYQVGPEVAGQFQKWFPERTDLNRQTTIDLAEANRRQLAAAGVLPDQILSAGLCTLCAPGQFHSHRGGSAGRMVSAIAVRG